jgi:hypothetical protein
MKDGRKRSSGRSHYLGKSSETAGEEQTDNRKAEYAKEQR